MRSLSLLIPALLLTAFLPTQAVAKAAFHAKPALIARAEIIAIVTITDVRKADVKGSTWTYRQHATATVGTLLKGTLPSNITLHGMETFICATTQFAPGRHLVFLNRDQGLLTGANWHLSAFRIEENRVNWFKDDSSLDLAPANLGTVLGQIRNLLDSITGRDAHPAR